MTNVDFNQNGFPKLDSPFVQPNRQIEIPWYRLLITLWNRSGGSTGGQVVPSGMMMDWGGPTSTIPAGWLMCDGSLVSRNTYSNLFAAIGTTWGAGDGVSTFKLPDMRGRYRKGTGGSPAPGTYGGNDTINLTPGQMPSHAHGITDPGHLHAVTDPGHTHAQNVVSNNTAGTAGSQGASVANATAVGVTGSSTTGLTVNTAITGITATDAAGSGDPITIDPAHASTIVVIKT